MELDALKKDILADARKKAQQILSEGQKDRERMLSDSKAEIKAQQKAKETSDRRYIEEYRAATISSAEFDNKKRQLYLQKEYYEKLGKAVAKKLSGISQKEKQAIIPKLLSDASKNLKVARVYCSEDDLKIIKGYPAIPINISGGIIAENSDGSQRLDISFKAMLKEIYQENFGEIAGILFSDGKTKI